MSKLSLARLKDVLSYDSTTGLFTWKKRTSNQSRVIIGQIAGTNSGAANGYINICIDGSIHRAHNLAWFYEHGVWPEYLDHKNGNGGFNAIGNLREVSTHTSNMQNKKVYRSNTSGVTGVARSLEGNWKVRINDKGKTVNLGTHSDFKTACIIRKAAEGWCGYHKEHGARV